MAKRGKKRVLLKEDRYKGQMEVAKEKAQSGDLLGFHHC